MSYTKTVWTNGATALSDANLNHIEQGIKDAHDVLDVMLETVATTLFPVGSIYMSVANTNPGDFFPNTTWVAWGSGRVPVGVDTGQTEFATVEKTGGSKTHTLTVNEMPSHNHSESGVGVTWAATGTGTKVAFADEEATTGDKGGGQAHNILQPYITCYMWKRTA